MIDCGFPIIKYRIGDSPIQWGRAHGEAFRDGIKELVEIRTGLMREKNAGLTIEHIGSLARKQWDITEQFDKQLTDELMGICEGANISITDIVILNNYTDFRDIQVPDQGCSLVYVNSEAGPVVGQTWDMHGSAKNYVCCIEVPEPNEGQIVLFSVVGCVGMMGFNRRRGMLGVNNINTDGAQAGALWPAIVRASLQQASVGEMASTLTKSPKTSGHNYLIAVDDHAQMWEVAPGCNDMVDEKTPKQFGHMFHTNHCLGESMQKRETAISQNSTTHIRFDLLSKKVAETKSFEQMVALMNDHEGYPKSICSNFQTDAQDPSITCGGAVGNLKTGQVMMWRGDKLYDKNYVQQSFNMSGG